MAALPISADDLSSTSAGLQGGPATSSATVTCASCGCRLDQATAGDGRSVWRHFGGAAGHDARGCSVACVTADHDAHGTAI